MLYSRAAEAYRAELLNRALSKPALFWADSQEQLIFAVPIEGRLGQGGADVTLRLSLS